MGKKLVLTGTTLTDLSAPKLIAVDAIESAGSLLLLDATHPVQGWTAGVPTSGSALPNLFGSNLGALAAGTTDAAIEINGAITNGTKGTAERSTKGGLHVIVSQTAALASGDGVKLTAPPALITYLLANPSHSYYISAWDRLTRAQLDLAANPIALYGVSRDTSAASLALAQPSFWIKPPATTTLASRAPGNTLAGRFANIALDQSAVPSGVNAIVTWGASPATYNNAVISSRNAKWPSFVFYRFYLEDLTVSGRTYATVDALDQALFTKEVLTSGGRYYGDTFTDPATVP